MKKPKVAKRLCKKTVKIGKKRLKKARPAELFLATVYETTYTRDADGDEVDSNDETIVEEKLYTLREFAELVDDHVGFENKYVDKNIDAYHGYFDGDYSDSDQGSEGNFIEYRKTVSFKCTERAAYWLERHWEDVNGARAERLEREEVQRKEALKTRLTIIDGGNAFCSRPSRADLKLVAS